MGIKKIAAVENTYIQKRNWVANYLIGKSALMPGMETASVPGFYYRSI